MWFIPAIIAMCIELCEYLDSLQKAIPIIFQISAFVLSAILATYFVYRRKITMNLFYKLETNFRPYMEIKNFGGINVSWQTDRRYVVVQCIKLN
jgi:hypothetical protein